MSILLYNKVDQNQITRRIDMSTTNIIAKITEIFDTNIEFEENFFKTEIIRGIEHTIIKGKLTYIPSSCEHCGEENEAYSIVKNGNQVVDILIGQFNSKPVILRLIKQRFYCKHCKRTFMAQTSLVEKNCSISTKVKSCINIELSENVSHKHISATYSVSMATVQRVLRSNDFKTNKHWLPEVLGIDEFKSLKSVDANMSVIICDVQTGDIIDIIPDRRKRYLREYLERFSKEARSMVKYITTDMYQTYIDLGKELFPNAQIVIDKFHIVQLFTRSMQKLRINVMNDFNTRSKKYKKLKRYWKVLLKKEFNLNGVEFYKYIHYSKLTNTNEILIDLLKISDRLAAGHYLYQEFLYIIHSSDVKGFENFLDKYLKNDTVPSEFKTAINTLNEYRQEIINALVTGYTNAVVEGNNNLIKSIKKTAFGFRSFRNLRLRVLLRKRVSIKKKSSIEDTECIKDAAA
ncbi:transposase [Peptostreptococcus anaerobius]|nr:transposase [Peptostreptococcus anaerobius]